MFLYFPDGNWPPCQIFSKLVYPKQSCCDFFKFSKSPPPSWIFEIAKFYWLFWCRGSRCISVTNFVKIGQSVMKILRFFQFFKMAAATILDCRICKFYWLTVSGGPSRIAVPNFFKIGCSITEILRFFKFSKWPPLPSRIFEIAKFYWLFGWRRSRCISTQNFVKIGHRL